MSVCELNFKLDPTAVTRLKSLMENHGIQRAGFFSNYFEQREAAGSFILSRDGGVVTLSIDEKSVETGNTESVKSLSSFGTFHTHPQEAYVRHGVCLTYPSKDDYYSIFYNHIRDEASFHILASVEGLYLISLSERILQTPRERLLTSEENMAVHEQRIYKLYRRTYPLTRHTRLCSATGIKEYIKEMNDVTPSYFTVDFLTWEQAESPENVLKIYYKADSDGACRFK